MTRTFVAFFSLLLAACLLFSFPAPTLAAERAPVDDRGIALPDHMPQRVAALSGSLADMWMLAGGKLVAATQDAWEEKRLALDDQTLSVGGIKQPNAELLLRAQVDFVLLTPTLPSHLALADQLARAGVATACFDVNTLADYVRVMRALTHITQQPERFETYALHVNRQAQEAIASTQGKPAPRVLLLRAFSSGIKMKNSRNNLTGAMLKDLGCINLADTEDGLLEQLSLEMVVKADPDFIFITTMGADDKALQQLADTLTGSPVWQSLRAVQQGHYHMLPKALYHYKPNARWGESYQHLAQLLYGEH